MVDCNGLLCTFSVVCCHFCVCWSALLSLRLACCVVWSGGISSVSPVIELSYFFFYLLLCRCRCQFFLFPMVRCMFHISLVFRCIGLRHFFSLYIIISIELECRWFTALFCTFYTAPVVDGSLHFLVHCWLSSRGLLLRGGVFCIVFFLCAELYLCVCASCFLRSWELVCLTVSATHIYWHTNCISHNGDDAHKDSGCFPPSKSGTSENEYLLYYGIKVNFCRCTVARKHRDPRICWCHQSPSENREESFLCYQQQFQDTGRICFYM